MKIRWLGIGVAFLAAAAGAQLAPSLGDLRYGSWGVDLDARDPSIRPGDDFDYHAGGSWAKRTAIDAASPFAGVYYDVEKLTERRIDALIASAPPNSPIGMLFRDYIDEPGVEAVGATALKADLAQISAAQDRIALAIVMGKRRGGFGATPVYWSTITDPDDSSRLTISVEQPRLALPTRDYYLDARFAGARAAYRQWIEDALRLASANNAGATDAAAAAEHVLTFETDMARLSWSPAESDDATKVNNRTTLAALEREAPGLPFGAMLGASGIKVAGGSRIIVAERSAVIAIAALYARTPADTLRSWLAFRTIHAATPYLSRSFIDARFPLVQALSGVATQLPRRERAIRAVSRLLGEPVGQAYVARFFDPRAKAAMVELTGNLKRAYAARITRLDWLGPVSKREALTKLDKMEFMLGYPDRWRDYGTLRLRSGDLYGNVQRIGEMDWAWEVDLLARPVDRKIWYLTPQTVNAYYDGATNQVVFPAARLQPPFFGLSHDAAANYGAIGTVIGHEISHGFDNRGRHYDAVGRLRDWWRPEDAARFEARIAVLGQQYDGIEALPGVRINGKLTMGENIADVAGVLAAHDAYRRSLGGKPAPVIDGLTGDQRFFLAYAQVRREKQRDADIRNQLSSGPHSPSRFRVIGAVRNVDAWYAAFDVRPGDRYFVPPEKRARIW